MVVVQTTENAMAKRKDNTLLEKIAREILDIETLKTRNSDSLDFHECSVWQIEKALQAAYDAGRAACGADTAPPDDDEPIRRPPPMPPSNQQNVN